MYKYCFTTQVVQPGFITGGAPRDLNHLAVIQPGEGAKHSLKILLYNDLKHYIATIF